ncbi:S-locus glycoprotein domain [Dillenia turbinata]|uniref:non-specific serine/threonine protein kinase n=1 Tax=Dillenia turbinata TaxID=194707 RepID=A0AAN8ZDQ9_9MAGN
MRRLLFIFFSSLVFSLLSAKATAGGDILSPNHSITDGQTLVSNGSLFELGFFSPGNSPNRYLGIWYKHMSFKTVWVANRENPLSDMSGIFTLTADGNLVILNGSKDIIWSSNTSKGGNSTFAQLLDSGNLVLRDFNSTNSQDYLWQSFDSVSDTFIPGKKQGSNLKTGEEWYIQSWKSLDDPFPGDFTYKLENPEFPQLFIRKQGVKQLRIGPWNGIRFTGVSQTNLVFTATLVSNEDEVYLLGRVASDSVIPRSTLNELGILQQFNGNQQSGQWEVLLTLQTNFCDNYSFCGSNAFCDVNSSRICQCLKGFVPKVPQKWQNRNWSDGCVRETALDCGTEYGFLKLTQVNLPDLLQIWINQRMGLDECQVKCQTACSCTAYSSYDMIGDGNGCVLWSGDLVDLKKNTLDGLFLYIKLPLSLLDDDANSNKRKKVAAVASSIGAAMLIVVCVCWFVARRKLIRQNKEGHNVFSDANDSEIGSQEDLELPQFDLITIRAVTFDFAESQKIGQGGFGPVYKAQLPSGQEIAVKRLCQYSRQGLNEFKNEVILISKLQHRNLVRLLGCCIQNEERILIYEYLPKGSLDSYIFGSHFSPSYSFFLLFFSFLCFSLSLLSEKHLRNHNSPLHDDLPIDTRITLADTKRASLLNWEKRFGIILGIARGLLYIHRDSRLTIIHRDLKASNILLDIDLNPKISDFGMARAFQGESMEDKTRRVVGTFGYMSPEYAIDGLFSIKSDVFSFGVLLLEIISGRRNRGFCHPDHEHSLLGHAWSLFIGDLALELVDAKMVDIISSIQVLRCIHVGLLCVQCHPRDRPTMSSVLSMLESDIPLPEPKRPGFFTERSITDFSTTGEVAMTTNEVTITLSQGLTRAPRPLIGRAPIAATVAKPQEKIEQGVQEHDNAIGMMMWLFLKVNPQKHPKDEEGGGGGGDDDDDEMMCKTTMVSHASGYCPFLAGFRSICLLYCHSKMHYSQCFIVYNLHESEVNLMLSLNDSCGGCLLFLVIVAMFDRRSYSLSMNSAYFSKSDITCECGFHEVLRYIDLNPKLSDFGMAKTFQGGQMEEKTRRLVEHSMESFQRKEGIDVVGYKDGWPTISAVLSMLETDNPLPEPRQPGVFHGGSVSDFSITGIRCFDLTISPLQQSCSLGRTRRFMKMRRLFFIFFSSLVFSLLSAKATAGGDILNPNHSITDGQTLVSNGSVFELGFFSPGNSTNRYLGIWYKQMSFKTVWVANRENPLSDMSGIFTLTADGNLVILNGSKDIIWSSNTSKSGNSTFAQLLDSGNLLLREFNSTNSQDYLWQSFDSVSDTFIPGTKQGINLKTGEEWYYQSWKSLDDPFPGDFTYKLENPEFPQLFIRKQGVKQLRIGPWNGIRFTGVSQTNLVFTATLVSNEDEVYLLGRVASDSVIPRSTLNELGILQEFYGNQQSGQWEELLTFQTNTCDNYSFCGSNAFCDVNSSRICQCLKGFVPKVPQKWQNRNWSDGCVRETTLDCGTEYGFLKLTQVNLPDLLQIWINQSMGLDECHVKCQTACSCTAYSSYDIIGDGNGCVLWSGDLVDLKKNTLDGLFLYIKLPLSLLEDDANSNKRKKVAAVASSIGAAMLIVVCVCWFVARRKLTRQNKEGHNVFSDAKDSEIGSQEDLELPQFDLITIRAVTFDFAESQKIGQGGFGPVYKAQLPSGPEIAVKRLCQYSRQGLNEFKNEVILISKLQHRNLVRLLGCCIQNEERILIYEYLPKGSLDSYIFGSHFSPSYFFFLHFFSFLCFSLSLLSEKHLRNHNSPLHNDLPIDTRITLADTKRASLLNWEKRFDIILGIARGLLYIHRDSRLTIIHRDLKASNILLDIDLNPKISDFGMARAFQGESMEDKTRRVVGTFGYMSPEYAIDGLFSIKSDVFSFGVLLLEIISGRRNRGFCHPDHEHSLLGHAWSLFIGGSALELVDAKMVDIISSIQVLRCIHVGLLCVQCHPRDRPTMSSVLSMLESDIPLPEPKRPGFFTERSIADFSTTGEVAMTTNEVTITLSQGR